MGRLDKLEAFPMVLLGHSCILLSRGKHYLWTQTWVERTRADIQRHIPDEQQHRLDWLAVSKTGADTARDRWVVMDNHDQRTPWLLTARELQNNLEIRP